MSQNDSTEPQSGLREKKMYIDVNILNQKVVLCVNKQIRNSAIW